MNGKTKQGIWLVVGAYLTYTGIQLVMDVTKEKPEGYIGFVVAGVLFAVFGIGLVVLAIKKMTEPERDEDADAGKQEDEDMQQEIDEIEENEENNQDENRNGI